jgi:hypothetical protein
MLPPKPANAVFGKPPSQLRFNPLIPNPHRSSCAKGERSRRSATSDPPTGIQVPDPPRSADG